MTVAILFSPQGSQEIGMGRELAEASPAARAIYDVADGALGWSVSTICWSGPEERLQDTRQTQPCLVTTSLACLAALREACAARGLELTPSLVAGHSVGEYAALAAAGVLEVPDALRLVAERGRLMAEAGVPGGMVAVIGLDRDEVARIVREIAGQLVAEGATDDVPASTLVVANDNAPGQVVISGTDAALEEAEVSLRAAGARLIPLRVSGPFHSPLMATVGIELAAAFERVGWWDAAPPVVSNVTAEPVRDAGTIRELLARQVSSEVEWVASVRRMVAEGIDTFIECGPGAALNGMVRRIAPDARTLNVADIATLRATIEALAEKTAQPARASV